MKIFGILIVFQMMLFALKVNIAKDMPFVEYKIDGKTYQIKRVQDTNHKLTNDYTKTSRPTPPFFIEPYTPIKGIKNFEELEVINFIKDSIGTNKGVLIDARMPKWYKNGTIPAAINIPFSLLHSKNAKIYQESLFKLFGAKKTSKSGWDFKDAKEIVVFDNGPWCHQGVSLLKALVNLGYPKSKLAYYRGGVQFWQIVGLNMVKNQNSILKNQFNKIVNSHIEQLNKEEHLTNLAGRQRMLSQKMSKDALMLSFDPKSDENLKKSINMFEMTLKGIEFGSDKLGLPACKDKRSLKIIQKIKEIWNPFKENLVNLQNSTGDLQIVIDKNLKLLKECNNLVQALKDDSNQTYLKKARMLIVDIAGRERMLIQKATKEKIAYELNLEKLKSKKALRHDILEFKTALSDLQLGNKQKSIIKPTNPKVKEAYRRVDRFFKRVEPLYTKSHLSIKELTILNEISLKLLKAVNDAVLVAEKVREY